MKAKHSLWQHPCGSHGWIDTENVFYKDGIVGLIVGQAPQCTTQFQYILDVAVSDYGNGLAYKQSFTSLHVMWKTKDFWHVLNQHFLY